MLPAQVDAEVRNSQLLWCTSVLLFLVEVEAVGPIVVCWGVPQQASMLYPCTLEVMIVAMVSAAMEKATVILMMTAETQGCVVGIIIAGVCGGTTLFGTLMMIVVNDGKVN